MHFISIGHTSVNFAILSNIFKLCSIAQLLLKLLLVFRPPISEMHLEPRTHNNWVLLFLFQVVSLNKLGKLVSGAASALLMQLKGSIYSSEKT
jgi:hypothetical protein